MAEDHWVRGVMAARFWVAAVAIIIAGLLSIAGLMALKGQEAGQINGIPAPSLLVDALKDKPAEIKVSVEGVSGPGAKVPDEYTCRVQKPGSPRIMWSRISGAASYAVIVYDPDAPRGFFLHLAVINIPPVVDSIDLDEGLPQGSIVLPNSGGFRGWYPVCPPSGRHRYVFIVLALDAMLPGNIISFDSLLKAIRDHVISYGYTFAVYP